MKNEVKEMAEELQHNLSLDEKILFDKINNADEDLVFKEFGKPKKDILSMFMLLMIKRSVK